MEIKIRSIQKSKIIDVEKSIISIQSNDDSIIKNLIDDYNAIKISNLDNYFIGDTVLNEITLFTKYPELSLVTDIIKKIELDNNFLDRYLKELSYTEKIFLNILRNISRAEKIIVFENLFLGLDLKNRKKLIKLINYLKEKSYIIFITSEDVDDLYNYSDYSIISDSNILKYGDTNDIYTDVSYLNKYKFKVPTLSYITYKAKEEKNIKLFYSKDVRDIIKDIYKHV